MFDDDHAAKDTGEHVVGQDLSDLSVEELSERIVLLRKEIERLEVEVEAKGASRSAADSLFKM